MKADVGVRRRGGQGQREDAAGGRSEGALWRQYSAGDMMLPAGVLAGIGVVGFVVGTLALRRSAAV